ncbi:Calcipressin-domain-containing protein [Trichocladium antarcticum]|uniref:Calcipressin-domain-containing protein n=1 Tax=Trichocladium antarcticum TaxID=1450529 RepID=A0AAN6UMW7_9PEZI|nr:Calcipressin-domain-containing protein [Trichocladium antarcticum]
MEQLPYRHLPLREMQQQEQQQSPPQSSPDLRPSSTPRSRKSTLTLDLSNLPPLTKPTPPSNTLIFTNLQSRDIFHPENLQTIRDLITQTAPIHTFAPLKSFARIIVSFFDESAAIAVRSVWDGEAVLGDHCKVYFGQPTPLTAQGDTHLALPDAGKLFFISPPPSPPHGWEVRMEDAPNKMVHAEDLAEALARLRHHDGPSDGMMGVGVGVGMGGTSPVSPAESGRKVAGSTQRSRSSTLLFQPRPELGVSPDLPCVTVDDMTDEPDEISPIGFGLPASEPKTLMAHTSRPPVELMHDA